MSENENITNKLNVQSLNIYQRMLRATSEIERVAKNLKVDVRRGKSYKAVAEADVLEAVKPIEEAFGIYSYPVKRTIIKDETYTTKRFYEGDESEKTNFFLRLEVVYRFLNVDKPDEYIDITTYGDGVDTQDKAPGKAMTYADKYALLKAYKIQTGDDPDAEPSGDLRKKEQAYEPTEKAYEPTEEQLQEAQDLGIELGRLAAYLKKSVENISGDDLTKAIKVKKEALTRKAAKAEAENGGQNESTVQPE